MPARLTVLGSGTSVGVPMIGCDCAVCHSDDPRDRRLRTSVYLEMDGKGILIDTSPDFRYQALRSGIRQLDAVIYTHAHADHIMGLDDVRPFSFKRSEGLPLYANRETLETIRGSFSYAFNTKPTPSTKPKLQTFEFDTEPFEVAGLRVEPILLEHGPGRSHGFLIGRLAYLTDHSQVPEESLQRLEQLDIDVLFLDALRPKPHPTHSHLQQSLNYVERIKPSRAYFIHMGHDMPHAKIEATLPAHIRLAYDNLVIEVAD